MTQSERIVRHLREHGSITSLEALEDYGIMRLASRVADLKKAGVPIRREMVCRKNRYGDKVAFARYWLAGTGGTQDGRA